MSAFRQAGCLRYVNLAWLGTPPSHSPPSVRHRPLRRPALSDDGRPQADTVGPVPDPLRRPTAARSPLLRDRHQDCRAAGAW